MTIKTKKYLRNTKLINTNIKPKVQKLKNIAELMEQGFFLNQYVLKDSIAFKSIQLYKINLISCIEIYDDIIQKGRYGLMRYQDEIECLKQTYNLFNYNNLNDFNKALPIFQDFVTEKNNYLHNKKVIFGLVLALGLAGLITTIILAFVCPIILTLTIPAKIWIVSLMLSIPVSVAGGVGISGTTNHELEDAMSNISSTKYSFFSPELPTLTIEELDEPLIAM